MRKLIREHIKPHVSTGVSSWQSWREQELWTLEVNDVLHANLDSLRHVMEFYISPTHKYMTLKDGINLCTRDTAL